MRSRILSKGVVLCVLLLAVTLARAQSAPSADSNVLTSDVVSFQCKRSFTDRGVGVCDTVVHASLTRVRQGLRSVKFSCSMVYKMWWREGKQWRHELRTVTRDLEVSGEGRTFASAEVQFSDDFTSITRETQEVQIARSSCSAAWTH